MFKEGNGGVYGKCSNGDGVNCFRSDDGGTEGGGGEQRPP